MFPYLIALLAIQLTGCSQPSADSRVAGLYTNPGKAGGGTTSSMAADGEVNYQKYCAACHGTLAKSTRRNATRNDLLSAISKVPSMSGLKLSDYQIDSIILVLTDSKNTAAPSSPPLNLSGQDLENFDLGASLYGQKCQSCHGALTTSSKRGITSLKLTNALAAIGTMASVTVTPLEKELIVFALNHRREEFLGTAPPATYSDAVYSSTPMKNRNLLGQKLVYLFATDNAGTVTAAINTNITSYIFNKPTEIGGLCFQGLDPGCPGPTALSSTTIIFENAKVSMEARSDALREAMLTNTCLYMKSSSTAISNVLAKASLTTASNLTSDNIHALWNVMFPETSLEDTTAEDALIAAVTTVATTSLASGTTKSAIWTDVITSFCQSPMMETY